MPKKNSRTHRTLVERTVYFTPTLDERITNHLSTVSVGRAKTSRSALIRKALDHYFKQDDDYWPLVFRRINNLAIKQEKNTRRFDLLCNMFCHFLAYFFVNWPVIPKQHQDERATISESMQSKYHESLKEKLQAGGYLSDYGLDDIAELAMEEAKDLNFERLQEQGQPPGSPDQSKKVPHQ